MPVGPTFRGLGFQNPRMGAFVVAKPWKWHRGYRDWRFTTTLGTRINHPDSIEFHDIHHQNHQNTRRIISSGPNSVSNCPLWAFPESSFAPPKRDRKLVRRFLSPPLLS